MSRIARYLINALILLACLGAGLAVGPAARNFYSQMFPEPVYTNGDFSALYRETGKSVVIFTTSTCPHCQHAREFLFREHIDFKDFVTDQSAADQQRFLALGGNAVPLLFIGDRRVVGFREDTLRESLAMISPAAR